jgi:drug/metabolite transporter (DMT)-like permease
LQSAGRSRLLLVLTAVIWGFAFPAQRAGMEHLGPLVFNGVRFTLGTLVLLPFFLGRVKRSYIRSGVFAGAVLFAGAFLQQWGIVYTTAGKAGFITGLYMVFVPLLGLLSRNRESGHVWGGVCLSLAGLWLLSFTGDFRTVNPGDLLVLAGALAWAFHVRLIGEYAGRFHPGGFAVVQFATVSFLSFIAAAASGESWGSMDKAALPLAYSGILSVGTAFTIQVFAQRRVKPAQASLIMGLEAVFAALGGFLLLGEVFSGIEALGAILMLCGMLLSQMPARA